MKEKNSMNKKQKNTIEDLSNNKMNNNSDYYPTNDNIASKNAASNYYTPNGD